AARVGTPTAVGSSTMAPFRQRKGLGPGAENAVYGTSRVSLHPTTSPRSSISNALLVRPPSVPRSVIFPPRQRKARPWPMSVSLASRRRPPPPRLTALAREFTLSHLARPAPPPHERLPIECERCAPERPALPDHLATLVARRRTRDQVMGQSTTPRGTAHQL